MDATSEEMLVTPFYELEVEVEWLSAEVDEIKR